MSSITATNSSTSNILTSLLDPTLSAAPGSASASTQSSAPTTSSDPVDVLDLSDRAKQILARANLEQAAADKLSGFLQSLKGPDAKSTASHDGSKGQGSLFKKLRGRAQDSSDKTTWTAGSRAGDASISDADFIAKYKDALEGSLAGFPPDKLAALQSAISNGTLKFQKGSEVEGYNTRTTVTYSVGPGGGQGMSTSGYRPPTGAVKEAIDSGNAVGLWTEDRGDVYVTW
ncbi:hypothetical protein [Bradyrhizobium neotropicale]|uniref:Uncharacterized protein n=1 Tax=Bradyrhizobium neotropicale TaxID=1497615 RepID=A0A176Z8Q8_9BRAD|nr:hypothetical protein [Bradyrhizobium neotropicale]OAF16807.1 hypothetical protein AXW67_11255 [Bradyrhizobium neotropicale]